MHDINLFGFRSFTIVTFVSLAVCILPWNEFSAHSTSLYFAIQLFLAALIFSYSKLLRLSILTINIALAIQVLIISMLEFGILQAFDLCFEKYHIYREFSISSNIFSIVLFTALIPYSTLIWLREGFDQTIDGTSLYSFRLLPLTMLYGLMITMLFFLTSNFAATFLNNYFKCYYSFQQVYSIIFVNFLIASSFSFLLSLLFKLGIKT